MGPADLKQITANLNQPYYKNILMDFKNNDDCGIFKIDEHTLLVQSVDFITPIVDDAYLYGQIAAANSLSDIFAKGARAHTAMSLLMWDKVHIEVDEVKEILQGGLSKLIESECALLGGHSTNDKEQKYGLSVTGIIQDGIFWKNNTASVGDIILLTKPIGSGIISTAFKNDKLVFDKSLEVITSMTTLNLNASLCAKKFPVSACTDVTGYGLIGHLIEMVNQNISIELYYNQIPFFDGVLGLADLDIIPGGTHENKKVFQSQVKNTGCFKDIVCYDAQTSGGLLIAVPEKNAFEFKNALSNSGVQAHIIAKCIPKKEYKIYIC
ncbi:selenide, water dikinase SelD [Helicobacter sp. 13S00477-4]|uniref:selenide, water dikinase SelD n=1 Tax=Helicobacter sp. 13S00477-4 TaxID=1905759 RepID=UPI000BA77F48|nr:selenide, water dikinase SelD [Helicobacter sp. 13S00477-4]PAF52705.1 selenide, water dikinase SelD [Helicobacter sp. 13S00477-4]